MSVSKDLLRYPLRLPFRSRCHPSIMPLTHCRHLTSTARRLADDALSSQTTPAQPSPPPPAQSEPPAPPQQENATKSFAVRMAPEKRSSLASFTALGDLSNSLGEKRKAGRLFSPRSTPTSTSLAFDNMTLRPEKSAYSDDTRILEQASPQETPPYHLHIFSHRHNTHITLTRPNRDPIISVSAGNIGIRKAKRGEYDAAYQLAAYVIKRIQEQGLLRDIAKLEIVLRGWGKGREAVLKTITGTEGRVIRQKIVRVTDSTRFKIGGTRGKKIRRL